jgi:hypothetical protein
LKSRQFTVGDSSTELQRVRLHQLDFRWVKKGLDKARLPIGSATTISGRAIADHRSPLFPRGSAAVFTAKQIFNSKSLSAYFSGYRLYCVINRLSTQNLVVLKLFAK